MARPISRRSAESVARAASERPGGDATVERGREAAPGGLGSGQVDAAVADPAFGDRRPGAEARQGPGQHDLAQIERDARAAGGDRRRFETAPQSPGAEAGLNVVQAERVIGPLAVDGDVRAATAAGPARESDSPGDPRRGDGAGDLGGDLALPSIG